MLDVNLRDKPVFPVADELIKRGIQIIFATGYDDGYAFPEHLAGCVRLRKPYFEHELKRRLVQTFADG